MTTNQINIDRLEYWFDEAIIKYVPNSRQKVAIDTNFNTDETKENYNFSATMTVIFYSEMPEDIPEFCRIKTISHLVFQANNLVDEMPIESIVLLLKQQYQFSINIFRQENMGKLTLPCQIDKNKINKELFGYLKEKYKGILYFHDQFTVDGLYSFYVSN